jgi:PRTRC genetic system protein E
MKDGENAALTAPLCVTGTAGELDAELVPHISRFVASHIGLNSNLTAIEIKSAGEKYSLHLRERRKNIRERRKNNLAFCRRR